jgi:hypothetical protein
MYLTLYQPAILGERWKRWVAEILANNSAARKDLNLPDAWMQRVTNWIAAATRVAARPRFAGSPTDDSEMH